MNSYEVFVSVVKQGSFSKAAKFLHRTPSAISKQMSALEQKLDVRLFDRNTRALSITEAGKVYYERCKYINQKISDAEDEIKSLSSETAGIIRLTWSNSLSHSKVVDVLSEFTKQYPKIILDIEVTNNNVNLTDENIDFAFRQGPLDDSSLVAIQLFNIVPVFCANPDFVGIHGMPQTMDALLNLPLSIPSYINLPQKTREHYPEFKWTNLGNAHRVSDIFALKSIAQKGLSASFLFRHMVEKELQDGSLVDICPIKNLPELPVYLVYQNTDYMPLKNRKFIDTFKEIFIG